jgi:hypothetical protein
MNRIQLIQQVIPLLYEPRPNKHRTYARSSYGIKHDVERSLDFYVTNDELIEAMVGLDYPHKVGDPNYTFYVKSKFPFSMNNAPSLRPKYCKKEEWENYLHARKLIDDMVRFLIQHDTSDDSRFTKLAKVVGYHS